MERRGCRVVDGELEPRRGYRASPACHRETTQSCEGQRFPNVTNRMRLTRTSGSVGAPGSNPWSDPAQGSVASHRRSVQRNKPGAGRSGAGSRPEECGPASSWRRLVRSHSLFQAIGPHVSQFTLRVCTLRIALWKGVISRYPAKKPNGWLLKSHLSPLYRW